MATTSNNRIFVLDFSVVSMNILKLPADVDKYDKKFVSFKLLNNIKIVVSDNDFGPPNNENGKYCIFSLEEPLVEDEVYILLRILKQKLVIRITLIGCNQSLRRIDRWTKSKYWQKQNFTE